MSIKAKIASDAEITRTKLLNSSLDDDTKERCNVLILHAVEATNGISQEEKIQNMTESIASLIDVIITNMCRTNSRLDEIEKESIRHHPTDKLEEIKKFEETLREVERYRKINGLQSNISLSEDNITAIIDGINKSSLAATAEEKDEPLSFKEKILSIFHSPWPWLFGMFLVFSPHFTDLLNALS